MDDLVTRRRFGMWLVQNRTKKQLGLREISAILQLSPTYVSMIEEGEVPLIELEEFILLGIASALEINSDEVFIQAGFVPPDIRDEIIRSGVDGWIKKIRDSLEE